MNNNRGNNNNNNRRRGRGNNRQQGGGGQQLNRIDSRARGNAPQMLEKYRKMALDAHLNDDRVQEEYYLQFADHYFRVIADQRVRQDEQRAPRREDGRSSEYGDDYGNEDEDGEGQGDRGQLPDRHTDRSFDRAPANDRGSDNRGPDNRNSDNRGSDNRNADNRNSDNRGSDRNQDRGQDRNQDRGQDRGPDRNQDRAARPGRPAPAPQASEPVAEGNAAVSESEPSVYEPAENPFVRDNRGTRAAPKPRKPRRVAGQDDSAEVASASAPATGEQAAFDAAILPPSISAQPEKAPAKNTRAAAKPVTVVAEQADDEEKPVKRRRARRASPGDDTGETLETVN